MISAAASAAVRRPRRAVQRTSATATGAAGSRYFGPSHGSSASSVAPATALPSVRALAHPQRGQRRAREHRAGHQVGVDGGRVRERGRREPDQQRRGARPRLGHDPPRQQRGEREAERRDRGEEQLDALRAAERVGGRDQQREAEALRLEPAPEHDPPSGRSVAGWKPA